MNLQVVVTQDGSHTIFSPEVNQHYHSTFGAIRESQHIFIQAGFLHALKHAENPKKDRSAGFRILEVGFGTGLNALLTQAEAEKNGIPVHYLALEAFPLGKDLWKTLNYTDFDGYTDLKQVYENLHLAAWNQPIEISPCFVLHKSAVTLEQFLPSSGAAFDLVYFDAFDPEAQPELWTADIFRMLFNELAAGGSLLTYSVKGTIVRAMQSAGFSTEKLPGPPGKRHILRAVKR